MLLGSAKCCTATRCPPDRPLVSTPHGSRQDLYIYGVFQGLKIGVTNAQVLLDFLCQTGPRVVGEDAEARRGQHTTFAEEIGDLRLQCQLLLMDMGTQVCSPVKQSYFKYIQIAEAPDLSASGSALAGQRGRADAQKVRQQREEATASPPLDGGAETLAE